MGVVFLVTGVLIVYVAPAIIAESGWESAVVMICLYVLGAALFHSFTIKQGLTYSRMVHAKAGDQVQRQVWG